MDKFPDLFSANGMVLINRVVDSDLVGENILDPSSSGSEMSSK
jgi:hypothetical protein